MPHASPRRAATAFVLITVLLDTLGLGLVIPVGPRLVGSFLGNDYAATSRWFGYLVTVYATMQFLFAPVIGGLSDRFGRRPVVLVSLLGAGVAYLVAGFAPALGWLFAGRVLAGITGASFSAAAAYIADVTPPEKRAQSFGLIGAVFGLGFILGPAIGGLLGDQGLRVPYFVAAGLNFVNLLYGIFVLPESLDPKNRRQFSWARANPLGAIGALGRHALVLGLTGTMVCGYFAQWILQSVWALYTQARYGWTLRDVGLSFMVIGFATALVQGLVVRVLVPRLGETRAVVTGLILSATGHVCIGLSQHGWMVLASVFPLALGGLAGPAMQALISREVGPKEQGEVQGSLNGLNMGVAIVAPTIGTGLLARFGPETATPHIPGAPFLACAAFTLVGLSLAIRPLSRAAPAPKVETA
jgi:DHA1 family tetracycline resistance protein-like MFS transporter